MKNDHYYFNIDPIEPEVGMGATLSIGSDCYPATIIETNKTKTKIIIQQDLQEIDEGYDYYSNQVYKFIRNPDGEKRTFTLRKNGYWMEMNGRQILSIGHKRAYQDPSF